VYPTNYQSGERYPCIVLTHGNDAKRRYFHPILQWAYPVQYWAEHGYFVLEVNEPAVANLDAALENVEVTTSRLQEELGYKPLKSIEAATQHLIEKGYLDPARIGIVGYSRGAWLARFALSHSKMFVAGSSGDSNLWEIGSYFMYGMRSAAEINDRIYGGPIIDQNAYEEYRKFATTARPGEFSGPLLQQFPAAMAGGAMEMYEFLRYAHVPTELAVFFGETHLLHEPANQIEAMQQNIDWFDYWVRGQQIGGEHRSPQYARWSEMARDWAAAKGRGKH
jgi:dipeptidyl aminopeptidase/acylaminoacyl peptidase